MVVTSLCLGTVGCQTQTGDSPTPVVPSTPISKPVEYKTTPYPWTKPANFPDPIYNFSANPLTYEGVGLGKMLFYDSRLSKNGTISCGFCHQPDVAFAHTDHMLSHGINDKIGPRNTPGLQNLAWSRDFFWDGGVVDLDLLPIAPIQNPLEMGDSLANVLQKVNNDPNYKNRFKTAFGSDNVTSALFLKALSQFMLTLVSANSKYDKFIRKEGVELTEQEARGLQLFRANCAGCHKGELFTDGQFRNNGLLPNPNVAVPDPGRAGITLRAEDTNKFRVPSLRNITMTPHYMHDGRFRDLEQVLNHYATGVQDSPALDPLLKRNGQPGLQLTKQEQKDIVSFLYTLTDYDYINDRRHHHD
jgi:cytochrome c peroxidase